MTTATTFFAVLIAFSRLVSNVFFHYSKMEEWEIADVSLNNQFISFLLIFVNLHLFSQEIIKNNIDLCTCNPASHAHYPRNFL